ncbi:hypothetical protein BDZ90DRAFT_230561 [Jaminaea rosea]|uniref:Uncharacterized protein n=1 Tax=Jaminaea rosea TaxID=1569628 RepID=A0A316V2Q2_9BASI|nr:hypothetical protein BDZ90DRAFT_230561 [Jaminaea rosea]PWN29705.1 hypothetical protein BDZ90DRAFT_230561 [Jaminaea rosea]
MASSPNAKGPLLSPEDLAAHSQTLEVLFAMWSGDEELIIDEVNSNAIQSLAKYLTLPVNTLGDAQSQAVKDSLPASVAFAIVVDPFAGDDAARQAKERKLTLDVMLPLRRAEAESSTSKGDTARRPRLSLRTATWLSRSDQDELSRRLKASAEADDEEEDGASRVMAAVEDLSEAVLSSPSMSAATSSADESKQSSPFSTSGAQASLPRYVLRTWHHLPSLSTKEKRDDLVSYAQAVRHKPDPSSPSQAWPLTGFVLAGKPGLVVLECPLPSPSSPVEEGQATPRPSSTSLLAATQTIDSYWSSIKSTSWGDIPSGHKKVSETLREEGVTRAFEDMREITGTEEVGGKEAMRGGWRNDMSKIEGWLKTRGAGGRLREALGADW